jgi:hypothetical protein
MTSIVVGLSAWIAFALWVFGEVCLSGRKEPNALWIRILWLVGALALTGHVGAAFEWVHGWSHRAAIEATARQLREQMGINWGGGVFINYLLVAWWCCDSARSWINPACWNQPGVGRIIRRAFFWFMWLNGAVVFAAPSRRVPAAALCLVVAAVWWRSSTRPPREL